MDRHTNEYPHAAETEGQLKKSDRTNSQDGNSHTDDTVDQDALTAAEGFYGRFKSACHGITRREELDQLYQATHRSFWDNPKERPEFSKVLFAMARKMRVLRVIRGGTLSWTAVSYRDDRRDQAPRDDRRPHYDDRRDQAPRDDRRPHYDDRRDQAPRDDRRPRYDDRRPRYDDRRQHDQSYYEPTFHVRVVPKSPERERPTREPFRAVSVERQ